MNTIPLTFDQAYAARTVVGGGIVSTQPVTVVLLNRGGRYYRTSVFEQLIERGFSSIVSIESSEGVPLDFDTLTGRFPGVTFVIPQQKLSIGEMINIGIAESKTPYCFVMWNDAQISKVGIHPLLIERLRDSNSVCFAPLLQNQKLEVLPSLMMPTLDRSTLRVERVTCSREMSLSIYAADFIGLYHRDRFIAMEGFDSRISDPYWQNFDFGFRSHLWNSPVRISTMFKVTYENEIPVDSIVSNDSYTRFFLKNIAVVLNRKKDTALLPVSRLPSYLFLSGKNVLDALRSFFSVRKWVRNHKERFIFDGISVIASWSLPKETVTE